MQSTCFEELQPAVAAADNVDVNVQNQHVEEALQSAEQEQDADILVIQPVANNDTSNISNNNNKNNNGPASRVYHGKSSHNTAARAKQFSTEVDNVGNEDAQYTVLDDAPATGTEDLPSPDHVELLSKVDVSVAAPIATATAPVPHQLDCWSISSCVLAAQNNYTIDVEQFCPSSGSSLNVSYIVPVSRFLQAVSLELHFRYYSLLGITIQGTHILYPLHLL